MLAPFQLWERMQSSGMRFTKSWNGASLRAVIAVARRHDATLREIRRMRRCAVASWCQVALCALSLLAGRADAQVDPSGRWRTLHTEHFRIHFRPAYRAVAEQEAREAERAYRLLAGELRAPRGVIDFVLGDDVDVANGATTVFPANRVDRWLPPPVGDPGLERFDSWLRLVTVHELTHVFHLDRVRGAWGVLQLVFGRAPGLYPNAFQPSWVIEGLATYYESKFTNGGRVRGSFHTQLLAADHAGGASRSPTNALLFTRWPDGLAPYAYGSRFFHDRAGAAGASVVRRCGEARGGQRSPCRVGRQLGRAGPGRELREDWARATRPEVPAGAPGDVLARDLWSEPAPQLSPDGGRVAYQRDDAKGARQLVVVDMRDWRVLRHHRVNAGVSYDWLGDTLVVAQLDWTSRWRLRSDLYRWLPDGGWRRDTRGARLVRPRAGGARLAAIRLTPAAAEPTLPAPTAPGAVWGDVAPSPDGRWVAATRNARGHWALLRWPADSPQAATVLRAAMGVISDPVWTGDGGLLFVAEQTGLPQVYRWSDSLGPVQLTREPLGARAPAPLPDGSLLYATLSARGWRLSRSRPAAAAAPAPPDEPAAFDSAPPVTAVETGYTAWPSLRPRFWLPYGVNTGPAGRFFGGVTAGRDAVGRDTYAGELLVSPSPLRAAGGFAAVTARLGNPTLDVSFDSEWSLAVRIPGDTSVAERDQNAAVGASFVARRFRTSASLRVAAEYEGNRFVVLPAGTPLAAACSACQVRDLVGGSLSLGLAHFVTAPLAISRQDGFAWTVTYRRREQQGTARWSTELRTRLALYARVPGPGGFAHHVLAARFAAGATGGPLADLLKVGRVSQSVLGLGFAGPLGGSRTFPVRGYRGNALLGRRAATATLEYRVPLALVGESLGHLPFGADKLWLALFGDAGDAWNPGIAPRLARLRSVGIELVGDVTVSYDSPLEVRLGVAQPLATPPSGDARRPLVYLALAADF